MLSSAIPVLCLRGADSDLVLRVTTQEMLCGGPGLLGLMQVVEMEGMRSCPALNLPDQLDRVVAFIEAVP